MGTFKDIKNKNQSARDMSFTMKYMLDPKKTVIGGMILNSGVNCMVQTAFTEMMTTKNRYHKTDKRMFYQFVQSFPTDTKLTSQEVHQIGLAFSSKQFEGFEVLVSTHCNTKNLHNHILVNSVSFETGKKLHQNHDDLLQHRMINDEICLKFGEQPLPTYVKGQKNKGMSSREYRSAMKGQSWKMQMMNTIDDCMKFAKSKTHFIYLMESEGYEITWTESRKNITYINSNGNKARDKSLHEDKYLKEMMENEFRIRESYFARIKAEKQTSSRTSDETADAAKLRPRDVISVGDNIREITIPEQDPVQPIFAKPTDIGTAEATEKQSLSDGTSQEIRIDTLGDANIEQNIVTGWEEERELLIQSEIQTSQFQLEHRENNGLVGAVDITANVVGVATGVESLLNDENPAPKKIYRVDKKTLQKIKEKKIAQGQRGDDIGNNDFEMTMY